MIYGSVNCICHGVYYISNTYLIARSLHLLTTFTHFTLPLNALFLVTNNLFSVSMYLFHLS